MKKNRRFNRYQEHNRSFLKTANGDTVAAPTVQYITVPLTGDQVWLVPHYYKSQTADSSYLYLMAQPKNSYCYAF